MKKTFLAKRNSLLSFAGVPWGALALAFVFLVLVVRLIAPNFFWNMFSPVYRATDAIALISHSFVSGFGNTAALAEKNAQLTSENAALAIENQALIQKEVAVTALGDSGIIAGVVARPPESPYDTLIIAAGLDKGVTLGMEAFGAGGVPLGVVSSVLADFSRTTLFSAPSVVTSGWVGNNSIPVSLRGAGAGAFDATVSHDAGIKVGDVVSVPGPGALPIGSVVRVDSDPSSSSVTLRIKPALNIFSVTWVILRAGPTLP